ncbi:MAG: hypothetical protein ACREQ3_10980 [Candidatus Binatia bacterium]
MTTKHYPRGWDESRVRRVLDSYEAQSDDEAAAEIEAADESTTMEVPIALVPTVRQLIAKRTSQRTVGTKTPNQAVAPDRHPVAGQKERERSRLGGGR